MLEPKTVLEAGPVGAEGVDSHPARAAGPRRIIGLFCVVSAVWLFLPCTGALAGIISLDVQTTLRVGDSGLEVAVELVNRGTAAAHAPVIAVRVPGAVRERALEASLPPAGRAGASFHIALPQMEPGRYPAVVRVRFQDRNAYPLSALALATFCMGGACPPSDLVVKMPSLSVSGADAVLPVTLVAMSPVPRRVRAFLVLPDELDCPAPAYELDVAPGFDEHRLDFELINRAGLPGAVYPVFAVCEYDANGRRHTEVMRSRVTLVARQNAFRRYRSVWLALAAVLAAGALIGGWRQRRPARTTRCAGAMRCR